jgi:DinB superfamily
MSTATAQIDDELHWALDGDSWHGPSFRAILADVTAETAAKRHPALAHSIGTLVAHTSVWIDVVRRRIVEWRPIDLPDAESFPVVANLSPADWTATLTELNGRMRALRDLVASLDPARLDAMVPGKNYTVSVMLHGTAQHLAYHGGQIAVLKKLV